MIVSSMTGYARAEGALNGTAWFWEARSVNSKGLDVRCRVPPGSEAIEVAARKTAAAAFARGSLSLSLQVDRGERQVALRINEAALEQVLALQDSLGDRVDPAPPRLDVLMAVRGIAETVERPEDPAAVAAREKAILDTLDDAFEGLAVARAEEGARLLALLRGHLAEIGRLADAAGVAAEAQPALLRQRLEKQVAELLEARVGVGEERLAQEAALLAAKADIREEIDRLASHVSAAGALLDEGGAIGRKLDFLCQELNREANTLCSKAADIALTRIGLDLKAAIEQFREQVQNVE